MFKFSFLYIYSRIVVGNMGLPWSIAAYSGCLNVVFSNNCQVTNDAGTVSVDILLPSVDVQCSGLHSVFIDVSCKTC